MIFVSHASEDFWNLYDDLAADVQKRADKQFALFRLNPFHPSLRLKPVGRFWSVRVSQEYRALAYREKDVFYWFWLGSHKDYENAQVVTA